MNTIAEKSYKNCAASSRPQGNGSLDRQDEGQEIGSSEGSESVWAGASGLGGAEVVPVEPE
jgi:hypothetical protein